MLVSEGGLCRAMNRAYKGGGYRVIPAEEGRTLVLAASTWAVSIPKTEFPRKALGLVVTHAGEIPCEPVRVCKDTPNQTMIPAAADALLVNLEGRGMDSEWADPLPLVYNKREELGLFRERRRGPVRAFRMSDLDILDPDADDLRPLVFGGVLGLWSDNEVSVWLCPWTFLGVELEHMEALARIGWEDSAGDEDARTMENGLDNLRLLGFEEGSSDGES